MMERAGRTAIRRPALDAHSRAVGEEATMARIEPLGINEVDDEIRHLCEEAERQSGTSASTRTYARNPGVLKALSAFRATLAREATIDPVLRELVRLKIAALNACRY
jgi:alkylhydroperoxidase family enzyme